MRTTASRGPRTALLLALLALAGCAAGAPAAGTAGPTPMGAADTGARITADDLRQRVEILAHDSMLGRGTGTPGARMAADYIAAELRRMGVRPAGDDGTYLARVPLVREGNQVEASARTRGGEAALGRDDLLLLSGRLTDVPARPRPAGEGPIVFGGYQADPAQRALSAEQLRGAVLVLRFGAPEGVAARSANYDLGQLWGPGSPVAAVVIVNEGGPLQGAWDYLRASGDGSMRLDTGTERTGGGGPPVFLASAAAAERLVGGPLGREPRTGLGTFRYRLTQGQERPQAWNVVGVLPGSDPARAGQYVAVGAHYDHVGVGEPVNGDSIYNGADDDASGTAAVIGIAERYAALPQAQRPARSLLFVFHTAEEVGLLGSEWFTDHPTVPRDSIVAQLNIDMIGRNHPDSVFLVGSRRISTQLGAAVEAANARQPRPMVLDYSWDAPGHPEQIFCRSDHYSYARYGIPVTFFTTGLHEDYHKPSDEPDTIDYEKLARVARLISTIAGDVANAPTRPAVDRPVPPLGAPCVQ
ncbi:MAG TPA: M28 family peptidase [Longimicrobiaceae bacterium]|nr:M28 family peptidase [Longimicrobiaceae bacterium]